MLFSQAKPLFRASAPSNVQSNAQSTALAIDKTAIIMMIDSVDSDKESNQWFVTI